MNINSIQLVTNTHTTQQQVTIKKLPWNSWLFSHSSWIQFKDGGNIIAVWNGHKGVDSSVRVTTQLRSHRIIGAISVHLPQHTATVSQ